MTEIEIIKELFRAFSTKEDICVMLFDGSSRTGAVCSFDGEKVLLNEAEIAISSIVRVGKEEAVPAQPVLEMVAEETNAGFISALLHGNKEEVERYFANPEMLASDGFTEQEVDAICSKKSIPLPWSDDERNSTYNQARRVYAILGVKDGIAQRLFEKVLAGSSSSRLCKKAVGALVEIYCVVSPEHLLSIWTAHKDMIIQECSWCLNLARALVRLKEYSIATELIDSIPPHFDMREVFLVTDFCKKYGTFTLLPNALESAIIAGDVPRLRLIAMDAEMLANIGYVPDEIKQIQDSLKQNINFSMQDDLSVAKRLISFQNNKNHAAEYYYVSSMQTGKKLIPAAQGLFEIYAYENRQVELHSIFERYLASTWPQRKDETGLAYISSLLQCGHYQKALEFWKPNAELLEIDPVVLIYMLLELNATDEDIQQSVSLPFKVSHSNIDVAKRVLVRLVNREGTEIIDAYLADMFDAAFAFLDCGNFGELSEILDNGYALGSHSNVGAGLSALKNGFNESNPLMLWFQRIALRYTNDELINAVRNAITVYVNKQLAQHSDVADMVRYIQDLGIDIPSDLRVYLRPQFTNRDERNAWLDQYISNASDINETGFDLFCQVADEPNDLFWLHRFICCMAKHDSPFTEKVIEKATEILMMEVSSEADLCCINEMTNCILMLGERTTLPVDTLVVLFHGFLFAERKAEAYIVETILRNTTWVSPENTNALVPMPASEKLNGFSLFQVLSDALASSDIHDVDKMFSAWGQYFRVTDSDVSRLSAIRDHYSDPNQWSDEEKESLAKHLFASPATPLYWQLLTVIHSNADASTRINIQFHRAIAENVSASSALENAIGYKLNDYVAAILQYMLVESNPDEFIRLSSLIIRILNKYPELLDTDSAASLLRSLNENAALRTDLQAWECVLDVAMEIAFVGDAVETFAEWFSPYLATSYPESNCRFLCNLLLRKPEEKELILSAFEEIQKSAQTSALIKIVVDILSSTKQDALTEVQRDVLKIITQCRKNIDENILYKYYTTSVSGKPSSHILAVCRYFEQYAPELRVFEDIQKYEILRGKACDDDMLALYVAEYASLSELERPERIAKVIINLIPGELYLKAKGYEVQSAFYLGRKLLKGYRLQEINSRKDAFKSLDKVFNAEKYPDLALAFMRSCFTRQWNSFILYDLDNRFINDILKNDATIKNLLFKKSYEVLKSGILAILDSDADIENLIDRVDALYAACGGIRRSKNYLRRIQKMNEEDQSVLRKVFSLRIESKTLRQLGVAGAAILSVPNNEKVAYLIGMLESRSLTELFDNNECLNVLLLMPVETATAISEIYTTFFFKSTDNLFSRYLKNQSEDHTIIEFSHETEEELPNTCEPFRMRYLKAKKAFESCDKPAPKPVARKYAYTKAEYLNEIVKVDSSSDMELLRPSPMDYLSVITWQFNKGSVDDIKTYIWKLETALLMPCLAHVLTLLGQYPQSYAAVNLIADYDWKIASQQILYRTIYFNVTCDEDRDIKNVLAQQVQDDREYFIGKFLPVNDEQRPMYVEKMQALCSFADELLKYMAFNGIDVSWAVIDMNRFNKSVAFYTQNINVSEETLPSTTLQQDNSIHDAIVALISPGYLSNCISAATAVRSSSLTSDSIPGITDCASMLKYLVEKTSDAITRSDLLTARNLVRWIYLLRMEESEFSRETFSQVLSLISAEDSVFKLQWDYILTNLYRYFENIESLQTLARLTEMDISNLRNIAQIRNAEVRILRKEDIDEWNTIIDVLSNLAGIDFSRAAESEQTLRLIGCRTKLVSIIEKKSSSLFDQISSNLLLLINGQIAVLRHNPELAITVLGEDPTNTQIILWEDDNQNGKLYAIVTNVGGADCKQISLVSYINTKRVKECWINTIYVGEKIPVEQAFSIEDLIDGVVTWDIELSYYDNEKNKTVVLAHKTSATVQIGGEPLNRGQISTGNPARGNSFVGRSRELALLRKHYSDISETPSLLIRGLRRSGKSSILLRLADELRKKNNLLVASVDGQSIAGDIRSAFIDKVLDSIRMNYRNNPDCAEIVQTQLMSFANEWKQRTANGNWIGQLDMFYYELSQLFNKKLLVMIDEMESIFYSNRFVSALEEEALYSALRSLIQRHENFVSFVFCGSDKLLTSCLEQRRESQMFQTLQFIEVGRMNNADIREIFRMQSEKYEVRFTSDAVDAIWQYTHGLVWYAKLLGYIVINNILENDLTIRADINRCDISNAVQMLINGEIGTDKYDLVDASLNTARSAIVHAMASVMPDFNKDVSVDEISTALKLMQMEGYKDPRNGEPVPAMNEKVIKQHLMFLERMQLVIANTSKTKYSFAAELYRLFFRKEKKLHVFEERRLK